LPGTLHRAGRTRTSIPSSGQEPGDVLVIGQAMLGGDRPAGQPSVPIGQHEVGRLDLEHALAPGPGLDADRDQQPAHGGFRDAVALADPGEGGAGFVRHPGGGETLERKLARRRRHAAEIARLSGRFHVATVLHGAAASPCKPL
jgi:hypothetical protein